MTDNEKKAAILQVFEKKSDVEPPKEKPRVIKYASPLQSARAQEFGDQVRILGPVSDG